MGKTKYILKKLSIKKERTDENPIRIKHLFKIKNKWFTKKIKIKINLIKSTQTTNTIKIIWGLIT